MWNFRIKKNIILLLINYLKYFFKKKSAASVFYKYQYKNSINFNYNDFYDDMAIPNEIQYLKKIYKDKYINTFTKILIHIPSIEFSPGGHSIFLNIFETLVYMGFKVEKLNWKDEFDSIFINFKPNIFLTSDDIVYLDKINWELINQKKIDYNLKIGFTASLEEYGNTNLIDRIKFAKKNNVDFFYSFRAKEYYEKRKEYKPFFDEGFKIYSIEFGVNVLKFFPTYENPKKIYDYIFFGSTNYSKNSRYIKYFLKIIKNYNGLICGPGWPWLEKLVPLENQKYYYQKSKICLNLHLDEQINWPCELNERTYILAACKVPQLIDNPALLYNRFNKDIVFSAKNSKQYYDLFKYMLNNYDEVKHKTNLMYIKTINNYTMFHRCENFFLELNII